MIKTIFERNFKRTVGLARLLVLEKLPTETEREDYMQQRRRERGRPPLDTYRRNLRKLGGNIKDRWEDEVAEWDVEDDDVSNYHTFVSFAMSTLCRYHSSSNAYHSIFPMVKNTTRAKSKNCYTRKTCYSMQSGTTLIEK